MNLATYIRGLGTKLARKAAACQVMLVGLVSFAELYITLLSVIVFFCTQACLLFLSQDWIDADASLVIAQVSSFMCVLLAGGVVRNKIEQLVPTNGWMILLEFIKKVPVETGNPEAQPYIFQTGNVTYEDVIARNPSVTL
jgi:hypothetical protein